MRKNIKPILFSSEMVKAILEGRKTQTRRIIKGQPFNAKSNIICQLNDFKKGYWGAKFKYFGEEKYEITSLFKPLVQIGDILWVRETWQDFFCFDYSPQGFAYKADKHSESHAKEYKINWKPSIHMPKRAARLFLEVTNVRVERLQDISDQDAIAEGIEITDNWYWTNGALNYMFGEDRGYRREYFFNDGNYGIDGVPDHNGIKASFFSLWASCYKWESVIANPWVWVYEFKQIEKPIDFLKYELRRSTRYGKKEA